MIFMQSYERRSKAIKKTSERQKKHCTADMMSDEEKVGDRHVYPPPNYCSERLNRFILKLDERLDSTPSSHARHTIVLGSPVEKRIPANAKAWLLKDNSDSQTHSDHNFDGDDCEPDLFGPSDVDEPSLNEYIAHYLATSYAGSKIYYCSVYVHMQLPV